MSNRNQSLLATLLAGSTLAGSVARVACGGLDVTPATAAQSRQGAAELADEPPQL